MLLSYHLICLYAHPGHRLLDSYDSVELEDTDGADTNTEPVFETVYALLNHLSPSYQTTFNSAVADKLKQCTES